MTQLIGIMDDKSIRAALEGKDDDAHQELFLKLTRRGKKGHGFSTEDSEDVAQETLIKAIAGLASFEGRSKLQTWVYVIHHHTAVNKVLEKIRKDAPNSLDDKLGSEDGSPLGATIEDKNAEPPNEWAINAEKRLEINKRLKWLGGQCQTLLILFHVFEFPGKDIAEYMGMTVDNVRKKLSRCRQYFRRKLGRQSWMIMNS